MLGSNDRTLQVTAHRLSERFKGLQIAGRLAPGPGFDPYSSEADAAIERIRDSGARLCFVALGAPRQALSQFSEDELVDLTMAVIAINSYNRINIAFRTPAGDYVPGQHAALVG